MGTTPGLMAGTETLSYDNSFGMAGSLNETLDTNADGTTMTDVDAYQAYTGSGDFSDSGAVYASSLAGGDSGGNTDNFDTERSQSQTLTLRLTGSSYDLSLSADASGTLNASQSDFGSNTFQDVTGLGPALQLGLGALGGQAGQMLAGLLGGSAMKESDNGSGTFQSYQASSTDYSGSQDLSQTDADGHASGYGAWGTDTFSLDEHTKNNYTDATTGNATVTDNNTSGNKNTATANETYGITESGTDDIKNLYVGDGSSTALTVKETASDNAKANDNGTDGGESVVTDPLEQDGMINPNPGQPEAANSLLAQMGSEDVGTSGNFNDKVGGSEKGTLSSQFVYQAGPWNFTSLTLSVATKDNFNLQDGGTDTVTITGSMAPDNFGDNTNQTDNGGGNMQYDVSGSPSSMTLAVSGGENDKFKELDNANANLKLTVNPANPVAGTPGGSQGAGNIIDRLTGMGNVGLNLGANDGFNLTSATYLLVNSAWVQQSLSATLTGTDTWAGKERSNDSDSESGNGGPLNSMGGLVAADNGTDNPIITLNQSGPTSPTIVTLTNTGQDNFNDTFRGLLGGQGLQNSNDPLAPTLDGSANDYGGTVSSGNENELATLIGGGSTTMNMTASVASDGTVTVLSQSADIYNNDTATDSDNFRASDAGTGSGSGNNVNENGHP